MKEPSRVKKYLKALDKIESYLEYTLYGNEQEFKDIKKNIQGMRELIMDLSLDRKEDHARFFDTLKKFYKVERK